MATNISGLFDIKTPQQARQEYVDQFSVSPQQRAGLGAMQQIIAQQGRRGAQLGSAVGGLFGFKSPQEVEAQRVQGIMSGVDMTSSEGLLTGARRASQAGDAARAQALVEQANKVQQMEQAQAEQVRKAAAEEAAVGQQQALVSAIVKQNPELPVAAAQSIASDPKAVRDFFNPQVKKVIRNLEDGVFLLNADTGERIKKVGDAQTDASGLKGLTAQLKAQQLADLQAKAAERGDKAAIAKKQDISRLARNENDAEIAINTGLLALGLAPTSAGGAFTQAAFDSIPWTDAKSLANLVESLNNEKAISTLQQLKEQSRTGATGFGALSEKELNLILAKTRKLDPTDKMFKENLKIVLEGWDKIRQESRKARLELQGVEDPLGLR